jgi:hypothetical protein
MDGWINEWMDEWMDGWMHHRKSKHQPLSASDSHIKQQQQRGSMNGWMYGWMIVWMDG